MPKAAERLATLNATLDDCTLCRTRAAGMSHVAGGGLADRPDIMLVFINPTFRNTTAPADWPGLRFPFANKPRMWGILAEAGMIDPGLPERMRLMGPTPAMVDRLAATVRAARLYVTNAVKCVDSGSSLPTSERVAESWPFLSQEIAIVRPRLIVAFGLIPFHALTGCNLRLASHRWDVQHGLIPLYNSHDIAGTRYRVFPCYFPTGRGNPVAAGELLQHLQQWRQTQRN